MVPPRVRDAAKIGGRHDAEPAVDKALVAVLKTVDLDRFFAIGHERFDDAAHGGVERLAVAATGKKTDPKHDESFRASYNMRISLPPTLLIRGQNVLAQAYRNVSNVRNSQAGGQRGIKHGMKSAALAWRGMLKGPSAQRKGRA